MYSPGLLGFSPGFCVLATCGLLQDTVAHVRTGCDPDTFGGRGGRGGFGTGGAGGLGRPDGAGGFGSGLPGGRIGSGMPGGILLLITPALATRPLCRWTSPAETSHPCQAESAVPPAWAWVALCRRCNEPNRSCLFLGPSGRFCTRSLCCSCVTLMLLRDVAYLLQFLDFERRRQLLARTNGRLSRLCLSPCHDNIHLHEITSIPLMGSRVPLYFILGNNMIQKFSLLTES